MDSAAVSAQMKIESVIYATDFSSCSEHAGQYAALFARQFGADMLAAHAYVPSQAAMEVEAEAGPGGNSAQRNDLSAALAAAAQRFGAGARSTAGRLLEGDPKVQIPLLAREKAPSMIVLGTQGRGRVGRGLMGSTAEGILRSADTPSLTVGPFVPDLAPETQPIRQVLYATPLVPAVAQGAAYAVGVAKAFHACLDVLHVVHSDEMRSESTLSQIRTQFHAALAGVLPQHAEELCNPRELIEAGRAHERILEHLREFKVNLLVLLLHKTSHVWLQERLSSAFHIIAHAPCPVMTITA